MPRLLPRVSLEHNRDHVCLAFTRPHLILSSAVLNGGLTEADLLLNLKVPKEPTTDEDPAASLARYCRERDWQGRAVGMMTAASMDSLRIRRHREQGVELVVLVTSGLSNPRRAGDRADYRHMGEAVQTPGTINTLVLTDARLTPAALVEAVMIATEAKAAALQDLQVTSPISGLIATGTGTDATAVVCGQGPVQVSYCGKHVLFGEILGRLVADAVRAASTWPVEHGTASTKPQT